LHDANLNKSDLHDADLRGTNLAEASLDGANLDGAVWSAGPEGTRWPAGLAETMSAWSQGIEPGCGG